MAVLTYEGVVENGQIRLNEEIALPEHAKVFVVVPDAQTRPAIHIRSPRLADPRQAERFTKTIIEVPHDDAL